LKYGGQTEWVLKGLSAVPKKLQNLKELNTFLAYKPWAIRTSNSIKDLVRGKDQWNISELMHAMMIMSFYHSWACFCFANGLKLEDDLIISKNIETSTRKKTSFDAPGSEKIDESLKISIINLFIFFIFFSFENIIFIGSIFLKKKIARLYLY
jgi:PA26 p53-induced protein (sestrin)